jgi:hypothetical protein
MDSYNAIVLKTAQRIAEALGVSPHQTAPIAAIITEELPGWWRTDEMQPSIDGVGWPLFVMNSRDRHPMRGYFNDGWRDNYGNLLPREPDYWIALPPLAERPPMNLGQLREAFIVKGATGEERS